MPERDWDERYAHGDTPWDTDEPDPHLVELVQSGVVAPGRTLEVGSGTGTNAVWLAARGFDVVGVDVSARAVDMANARAAGAPGRCAFSVLDFLADDPPSGPFDFVFDRGCFHVFDAPGDRSRFAQRVAAVLRPEGRWLSLIGSSEGPARDHGPPRRSARDVAEAIEPALELLWLRGTEFHADLPSPARAWLCLARRRTVPAQPSTRPD
jgi:SAM-dependent methyltransferase